MARALGRKYGGRRLPGGPAGAGGPPGGPLPGASLSTPLDRETLAGWRDWLTRQWLYLKFCMPGTWLAGGLWCTCCWPWCCWPGCACCWRPWDGTSRGQALAAALFLAGLTGLGLALRSYHPQPGPVGKWLAAFFAALAMASWCHLRTLLTREMRWRGILYRVGWRGKVGESSQ